MTSFELRDLAAADKNGTCACCATAEAPTSTATLPTSSDRVVTDLLVEGMTCSHCVRSVTEELLTLDGVLSVNVELHAGGTSPVTVASTTSLDAQAVQTAVEEAGYRLAGTT